MKPHKHAELIKAWADGREIQYRSFHPWDTQWQKEYGEPDWNSREFEYRIKPDKVVRWLWAWKDIVSGEWMEGNKFMDDDEAKKHFYRTDKPHRKLEYTRQEFDQ